MKELRVTQWSRHLRQVSEESQLWDFRLTWQQVSRWLTVSYYVAWWPWWWRQSIALKCITLSTRLHSMTSHKIPTDTLNHCYTHTSFYWGQFWASWIQSAPYIRKTHFNIILHLCPGLQSCLFPPVTAVLTSLLLGTILSQLNPVHTIYLCKTHCNSILLSMSSSPKWSLPFQFSN
jgi:hypothetical protein